MISIVCDVCGCEGKAGNLFVHHKSDASLLFLHLGHDPYRCRMHYRCPFCGSLLSVDPMDMLQGFRARGIHCPRKLKLCRG